MAKLNTYVHATATGPDGVQLSGTFGPGDDLPDWAAAAITNPDVWDGDPPARPAEPAAADGPVEPPRSGKGSSVEAWRKYATDLGWFESIPEGASRDDIAKAVDDERERRAAEAAQNDGK